MSTATKPVQAAAVHSLSVKLPLHLRLVRHIRNFSPSDFVQNETPKLYLILMVGVFVGFNYRQYLNMKKIYPDYDKYAQLQGARYNEAKAQELHDVMRYNTMVSDMRNDMKQSMAAREHQTSR